MKLNSITFLLLTILLAKSLELCAEPKAVELLNPGRVMATENSVATKVVSDPAPMPSQKPAKRSVVPANPHRAIVERYATKYSVDADLMDCILFRESSYRTDASNTKSTARGIAQFLKGTWVWMRTRMGSDTQLNLREDAESAIETLAWALSKGYKNHWQVVTNGSCN